MNKGIVYISAILILAFVTACGDKQKQTDIITTKPVKQVETKIQKVGDYRQSMHAEWMGTDYQIEVSRKADATLPVVTDVNGSKYYDNRISIKVIRPDGSEFFARTFTKDDFSSYLDADYKKHSALLGIVYDYSKGNNLYFAASVGSADKMSDDYIPLIISLSKTGAISISRDTRLDTSGMEEGDEDEGV